MRRLLPLLLLLGCPPAEESAPSNEPRAADVAPVRVATAATSSVVRTLELGGVASAWRSARLAPTAQGVVTKLPVELGQVVKKGTILAELDTSTLRLQIDQARKTADLAQLQLDDAQRQSARADALAAESAMTQQQLDQATLGLQLAQAQHAQATAQLAVITDQLDKARLKAPFAGTVTHIGLEQGEFFSAMGGLGGPPALVGLDALDTIKLDVRVPDVDLALVREGMDVLVTTDALPGRTWPGTVALVNAAAEPGTRSFLLRIRLDNEDHSLRPGLFLTARLILESREDVLAVPEDAVTNPESEPWVMILEGSKARRKPVTLGLKGDGGWEVEGIAAGDQVVVEGHFGLPDGSAVRVIE